MGLEEGVYCLHGKTPKLRPRRVLASIDARKRMIWLSVGKICEANHTAAKAQIRACAEWTRSALLAPADLVNPS